MTTYYKGNNIGLNYDAAAGTWSFSNLPQDFIDPNAFSTPDPVFPTAPTEPTTPTDPTPDPCPPGYVYDETLQQCVPDPNYQNPFRQDNQGGGQDDDTGTGLTPFPDIQPYVAGTPGGGKSYVPTVDTDGLGNVVTEPGSAFDQSGIDYSIFNYGTYAPTRAQMNEHMLITYGLDKGWLSFDDEKNAYRKIQFKEQIDPKTRNLIKNQWALNLIHSDSHKNYKDYFEILEKGWQPSNDQNIWKKWIQGNAQYSLTGGMIFKDTSTRGGRTSDVTYVGYSKDKIVYEEDEYGRKRQKFIKGFETKIKEAMSIKDAQGNIKGIIDREGNVNVRADDQGGYYDSKGNYIGGDGSRGSSLLKGMQYLINLKNSGIKLPDNLKKRLFKGINSKALTPAQKANYASQLGYNSWNDVKKDLDTAVSDDKWWQKDDDAIIQIDDASSEIDVDIDDAGTPSGDTSYTPPGTKDEADVTHPIYGDEGSYGGGEDFGGYQGNQQDTNEANVPYSEGTDSSGQGSYGGGEDFGGYTPPPKDRKTCFHPEQLIGNKFIKDLEPGDLINGIKILGIVKLKLDEDMYSLNDVRVTGTHKVKYNNTWMYVSEHPDSFKINDKPEFVYVPIVEGGTFIINNNEFADYDDEHIETLDNKLKVA